MTIGSARILVMAATAATLLAGGGPPISAQQTGADQPPAFRSGVEVVTVDVGVTDRLDVGAAVPVVSLSLEGLRFSTYRGARFLQLQR